MLPIFPQTKTLELSDKSAVEEITFQFLPYTDFYFFSLWTWNIHDQTSISTLDGNLIVLFHDYETNEPFFSYLGSNNHEQTIRRLLSYANENGMKPELKLIPEQTIFSMSSKVSEEFEICDDRDNFDYVLSTEKLLHYDSSELYTKKKNLNRFKMEHKAQIQISKLTTVDQLTRLNELRSKWSGQKGDPNSFETHAEARVSNGLDSFNLELLTVEENSSILAYEIFEVVQAPYAIASFQRGDRSCVGIYEFMNSELSKNLLARGTYLINIEQDAGVPGLRQAKMAYDPKFLKKFIIREKR